MTCDRCQKQTNKLWNVLDRKKSHGREYKDSPRMNVCDTCCRLQWLESFPVRVIPGQRIWMKHKDGKEYETGEFEKEVFFSSEEQMIQYTLDNSVLI